MSLKASQVLAVVSGAAPGDAGSGTFVPVFPFSRMGDLEEAEQLPEARGQGGTEPNPPLLPTQGAREILELICLWRKRAMNKHQLH